VAGDCWSRSLRFSPSKSSSRVALPRSAGDWGPRVTAGILSSREAGEEKARPDIMSHDEGMTQPAPSTTRSVIEESKWVLRLFNDKVARLENHSFRAYYQENGLRYSGKVNPETGGWEWEWNAPGEDSRCGIKCPRRESNSHEVALGGF
jgi:hypothetical protein